MGSATSKPEYADTRRRTGSMRTTTSMSSFLRECSLFQAEDGIRDDRVTGVQTCALPIFENIWLEFAFPYEEGLRILKKYPQRDPELKIGRASCRERV